MSSKTIIFDFNSSNHILWKLWWHVVIYLLLMQYLLLPHLNSLNLSSCWVYRNLIMHRSLRSKCISFITYCFILLIVFIININLHLKFIKILTYLKKSCSLYTIFYLRWYFQNIRSNSLLFLILGIFSKNCDYLFQIYKI